MPSIGAISPKKDGISQASKSCSPCPNKLKLSLNGVLGKLQAWLKLVRERDPGYGLPTPCTCRLLISLLARARLARQLSLLSCKHQHWVSLSLVRLIRLREKFGFQEVIYKFRKKQGNPWKKFLHRKNNC